MKKYENLGAENLQQLLPVMESMMETLLSKVYFRISPILL